MDVKTQGTAPSVTSAGGYGNNSGGVTTSSTTPPPPTGTTIFFPDGKGGKVSLTAKQYLGFLQDPSKEKQAYTLMVQAGIIKKSQTKPSVIATAWQQVGLEATRNNQDVVTYLQNRATQFGSTTNTGTTTKKYALDLQGNKVPVNQLSGNYLGLDAATQNQVIQIATELGKKPGQASGVWNEAVAASSNYLAKGIYMNPLQVLQKQLSDRSNKPITYSTTTQAKYDPTAQTAAINQTYINLIGRAANPDEINSIVQQANAQKQVETTTYLPGGINRTTVEKPTPDQIAQQQLLTSPQYATERKGMQDLGFLSWLNNTMAGGTAAAGGQANG